MKTIENTIYTFDELDERAKQNAYDEWRGYVGVFDVSDHLAMTIDYDVRKALETIGLDWDCDSYGHMWPIMRGVEIPQDGHAHKMADRGDYATMDIADVFNSHGPKMEEYASMWYQVAFPESGSCFYECDDETSYELLGMYESLYLKEYERAAQDALNKWYDLREAEEEYLTSFEAFADEFNQGYEVRTIDKSGRVYYSDCRKWYTVDGEFYEQSNTNHECISIVATR